LKKFLTRINTVWVPVLVLFLTIHSLTVHAQVDVIKQNYNLVKNLEPKKVLANFAKIAAIPHCSGNESAIADTILAIAKRYHLIGSKDTFNNVFVVIPASPGYESQDSVSLQVHLDMVCQSRSPRASIFPIQFIVEGDVLRANGTTLGGDNGIGVASLITIMEENENLPHCRLELIFTTGEENGLTGANGFNTDLILSSRMYNLDAEDWGSVTIGCAGGVRMHAAITPKFIPSGTGYVYDMKVSGLKGGHSGVDISPKRGNAIKLLNQMVSGLENFDISLVTIGGGSANNTIPREAEASVFLPCSSKKAQFKKAFKHIKKNIIQAFPDEKPKFTLKKHKNPGVAIMDPASQSKILEIISRIPNGVIEHEPKDTNLVRTSNNIGIVEVSHDTVFIRTLFRSSSEKALDSLEIVMEQILKGQISEKDTRYPAWEPDYTNPVLISIDTQYEDLFGIVIVIRVTHGGLEAAIFFKKKKFPIVAFGPNAHKTHTPDESVEISSIEKYWKFLCKLISYKK
jgi:dipeptidase D